MWQAKQITLSDTLENLQKRKQTAGELASVVRTMKAMAASNINQYEMAVDALQEYDHTVSLGLKACMGKEIFVNSIENNVTNKNTLAIDIVFGSDQGLVGRFNDALAGFVQKQIKNDTGERDTWTIGERIVPPLEAAGIKVTALFAVPNSITAVTPLVNEILLKIGEARDRKKTSVLYIFHNKPATPQGYEPALQRLLPLDAVWENEIIKILWPTKNLPQVIDNNENILPALISEYLFVSIYKACAESLASENAARLEAMQRAEKNIDEILGNLNTGYNRLRQSMIDEELFDVIAGFEALKNED